MSIVLCALASLLVVSPGIHGHEILPAVDLVLDTIAMVVFIALTSLAWARFRERHVVAAAYHAAAFLALAVAYSIALVTSLQQATNLDGLGEPENVQVLVFAVARLAAAILFVLAGVSTRRPSYGWRPTWILVAPMLAVFAAALVGWMFDPPPDALLIITFEDSGGLPHITPFGAAVHLTTSALFFAGAYVSRDLWHAGHSVIDGWIAVGLVFAGFAELHWVLYPSAHPGQVSTADVLVLAFSACLLAGMASAFRANQRELRAANVELGELRDAEVELAATRSERGWRGSCTTGWRRTCGWPRCERASCSRWMASPPRPGEQPRAPRRRSTSGSAMPARPWPPCAARRMPIPASAASFAVPSRTTETGSASGSSSRSRAITRRGSRRGARPRSSGSPRRHCPTSPAMPTPPWSACAS